MLDLYGQKDYILEVLSVRFDSVVIVVLYV